MTAEEFLSTIADLRNAWATDSNAATQQENLFQLCERFIGQLDEALDQAEYHPDPPPPRVRP